MAVIQRLSRTTKDHLRISSGHASEIAFPSAQRTLKMAFKKGCL